MNKSKLAHLMTRLGRLPGLGPRSGRRTALYLLKNRQRLLKPLIEALQEAHEHVHPCNICGFLDERNPCTFCQDSARDSDLLCVVSEVGDVWALERTRSFKGYYHVLGGNLSVMEGIAPKDLRIASLLQRCRDTPPKEILLALSPTVEGQATAHYISQEISTLENFSCRISTLARGIPLGGELDYLDDGTLSLAVFGRKTF